MRIAVLLELRVCYAMPCRAIARFVAHGGVIEIVGTFAAADAFGLRRSKMSGSQDVTSCAIEGSLVRVVVVMYHSQHRYSVEDV